MTYILFVVTSHREMGPWLEELAAPYLLLRDRGFAVRIASPDGGAAVLDATSLAAPWLTEAGQRFLDDAAAMADLGDTQLVGAVDPAEPIALYLVGGTGTMWDFPASAALGTLVGEVAAAGKPVAAICHGVSGLLSARTADGVPLVAGRRITCFTDAEEEMLDMHEVVPLLAETALRAQGAIFSCAGPFEAHVVVDDRLSTGQNPASAVQLGERLAEALA